MHSNDDDRRSLRRRWEVSKMMICLNAKNGSCKFTEDCPDSIEHECNSACTATGYFVRQGIRCDCPACIPVDQQPPACPECGHTISDHFHDGCRTNVDNHGRIDICTCKYAPADQEQKHCTHQWASVDSMGFEFCVRCGQSQLTEQPKPQMPLTQVTKPDEHYTTHCFGCGTEEKLMMIPARRQEHIVGWIFSCTKCEPSLIGKLFDSSETLQAHDAAIRAQARREFVDSISEDKLVRLYCEHNGWEYGDNEDYDNAVETVKWFMAHIKAEGGIRL